MRRRAEVGSVARSPGPRFLAIPAPPFAADLFKRRFQPAGHQLPPIEGVGATGFVLEGYAVFTFACCRVPLHCVEKQSVYQTLESLEEGFTCTVWYA